MKDLVDLKREKEPQGKKSEPELHGAHEDYPYGTRLHLEHEELQKFGLHEKLPAVGHKMRLHGIAHVVGVHEDNREGQKPRRRVELHIKQMALHPHNEEKTGRVPGKHSDMADGAKAAMDGALASQSDNDADDE